MSARKRIAALLWWSVPSGTNEEAKERTEELLDAFAAETRVAGLAEALAVVEEFAAGAVERDMLWAVATELRARIAKAGAR